MKIVKDSVVIETVELDLLEELAELHQNMVEELPKETPKALISPEECLNGAQLPPHGKRENYELLTICAPEILVGYASIYRDFPGKAFVELPTLYIAPLARGNGIGGMALKALYTYFAEAGYRSMRVSVSVDNRDALRFFVRHGFKHPLQLLSDDCGIYDDLYLGITLEKHLNI